MVTLLAVAFFISSCGSKRPESPEAVSEALVNAIKAKDEAAFKDLLITKEAMSLALDKSNLSDDEKKERREKMDEEYESRVEAISAKVWSEFWEEMKELGIDGSSISVEKQDKKQEEKGNVVGALMSLSIKSGDKSANLNFTAIDLDGWYLLPDLDLYSEDLAPVAVDSLPVSPEPLPEGQ